ELAQTTRLEPDGIRTHLRALAHEYTERESAIEVAQIGTKWTMQIRSEFAELARGFAPPEIDRDLLKTAALIAYHQPLLQSDLFDMIGSKVYEHTKGLEDLGLINRKPSGRSLALTTTRYFAEFFGLKSTDREGIPRPVSGYLRDNALRKHLDEKVKETARTRQAAEDGLRAAQDMLDQARRVDTNVAEAERALAEASAAMVAKDYKVAVAKSAEALE